METIRSRQLFRDNKVSARYTVSAEVRIDKNVVYRNCWVLIPKTDVKLSIRASHGKFDSA